LPRILPTTEKLLQPRFKARQLATNLIYDREGVVDVVPNIGNRRWTRWRLASVARLGTMQLIADFHQSARNFMESIAKTRCIPDH
jgi:hypothetical protein